MKFKEGNEMQPECLGESVQNAKRRQILRFEVV